jgi:hypothetical protein
MTGNQLRLDTKRATPEALSGRADFSVMGNREAISFLNSALGYMLGHSELGAMTFRVAINDGSTLSVQIVPDGVNV